jgi:hypothetical protein
MRLPRLALAVLLAAPLAVLATGGSPRALELLALLACGAGLALRYRRHPHRQHRAATVREALLLLVPVALLLGATVLAGGG